MSEEPRYFEHALSDFMYEVASGGAIRRMVERGCSVEQIMKRLDFPTPRARVEKTVFRYMIDSGMLLTKPPVAKEALQVYILKKQEKGSLLSYLAERVLKEGEENSYMSCPFGKYRKESEEIFLKKISSLNKREQEYLTGIYWERNVMYHRLNSRMREIGAQLAAEGEADIQFCFFKSKELVMTEPLL